MTEDASRCYTAHADLRAAQAAGAAGVPAGTEVVARCAAIERIAAEQDGPAGEFDETCEWLTALVAAWSLPPVADAVPGQALGVVGVWSVTAADLAVPAGASLEAPERVLGAALRASDLVCWFLVTAPETPDDEVDLLWFDPSEWDDVVRAAAHPDAR